MEKQELKKKGLDTLKWLVAFPVPITKKLAKRKGGKTKRKAATIAAAWAMYLGLATAGVTSMVSPSHGGTPSTDVVQVSTDNPSEETDWNDDIVAEGQAAMECHTFYLNRLNMPEGLPREVYCVTKINGEDYRNDWIVAAGESLTIETTVIDSRNSKHIGSAQSVYIVKAEDLINGFEITSNITVDDKSNLELGLEVMAVYTFSPKEREELVNENELAVSVTDTGLPVGGRSVVVVSGKANSEFVFSSSNNLVATVSNSGVIDGISPGEVTITATEIATGKKGYVTIYVGIPKWASIDSYVTMEDGYLDESEWEVTTLVGSKIGYDADDLLPGDTRSFTLRVKRKSDSAVFVENLTHVVSTGDYENGFTVRIYLPVTVNYPDGTEHTEYFYATFNCTYADEDDGEIAFEDGLVLDIGESVQLTSKMISGTDNGNLKYTSNNPEIVTVDANGLVTGVAYGYTDIVVNTGIGQGEYIRVYVAKQRNMKLTTKVVQTDGEFNPEEWDVTLLINGEPCEEYYDAKWNELIEFDVGITKKGAENQSAHEVLYAYPSITSIIDGFQEMMTVSVSDGVHETSFRVYFHFDGDLFTASNGKILGKTGKRIVEIYCEKYYLSVGESTRAIIESSDAAYFLPDEGHPWVFESGDESVIKVGEKGTITAVGSGKTYLLIYLEETGDFGYVEFEVE